MRVATETYLCYDKMCCLLRECLSGAKKSMDHGYSLLLFILELIQFEQKCI